MNLEKNNKNNNVEEYTNETSPIIAQVMKYQNELQQNKCKSISLSQVFNLKQGIMTFGSKGINAVNKELIQLISRNAFSPINPYQLPSEERGCAMESLIF